MFTGIVTHVGTVVSRKEDAIAIRATQGFFRGVKRGGSVSVDGTCLTAVRVGQNFFTAKLMPETVNRTNLRFLSKGNLVNLELPARVNSFLSGHLVEGHVDGTVKLQNIIKKNNSRLLTFSIPNSLSKYVVEKGSIAINGISLTVVAVTKNYFSVGIIPHTWVTTMLRTLKVGDLVNLEVDVLAKYVEKLLKKK